MKKQYSDPIAWEDDVLIPAGHRPSTPAWRAIIKGIYGSPLTEDEHALFVHFTRGVEPRPEGWKRVLIVGGRRGGKSDAAGRIAYYEATQVPHYRWLAPGAVGTVAIVAQELDKAQIPLNNAKGFAEDPTIGRYDAKRNRGNGEVKSILGESIFTRDGIEITKVTASEKSVRGPTMVCAILDEIAAWGKSGPTEDAKVVAALTPALMIESTAPKRRIIACTSAGYRNGWAFEAYEKYVGKTGSPWLVITATTQELRPTFTDKEIDDECAGDEGMRIREFDSVWSDMAATQFFPDEVIAKCVDKGRLAPIEVPEGLAIKIALDPAFKGDAFTCTVAASRLVKPRPGDEPAGETTDKQRADGRIRRTDVLAVYSWKGTKNNPLSPTVMAARIAEVCSFYGVRQVYSDQHADVVLAECFSQLSSRIKLVRRPWTVNSTSKENPDKTTRFTMVRNAMVNGAVTLPNHPELIKELGAIVATPQENDKYKIEAPVGQHDDLVDSFVLAVSEALIDKPRLIPSDMTGHERAQQASDNLEGDFALMNAALWF